MIFPEFITIQNQLSEEKQTKIFTFFANIFSDVVQRKHVFNDMSLQYQNIAPDVFIDIHPVFTSWYTKLGYKLLLGLPKKDGLFFLQNFFPFLIKEQFSVVDVFCDFLYYKSLDEDDMKELFVALHTAFIQSKVSICLYKNEKLSFASFYIMVTRYEETNDNLALASYYSDIDVALQKDANRLGVSLDSQKTLYLLQELVHFLQGVTKDTIFYIVDAYAYPEKYDIIEPQTINRAGSVDTTTNFPEQVGAADDNQKTTATQSVSDSDAFFSMVALHKEDFSTWMASESTQQSLIRIFHESSDSVSLRKKLVSMLMVLFPNIGTESEAIIHTILGLDAFLKEQGFSSEHDFLYFDGDDGVFHWDSYYIETT